MSFNAFATEIAFSGAGDAPLAQRSVNGTLSRQLGPRTGLQLAAGAILDGEIAGADLDPGFLLTAGASYLALYERRVRPFVLLSASLGVARSTAAGDALWAGDLRVGIAVGKTFFSVISAYVVARGFAGPVLWGDLDGTDVHHHVVGGGGVIRPGAGIEVFAEAAPLGERSVTVGASVAF